MSRTIIKAEVVVDSACEPEEAANSLGMGIATIWQWIRDDTVIALRNSNQPLIPRSEIERLKKQNSPEPENG